MERIIEKVEFKMPAQPKFFRVAAYARVSNGKDTMLHSLAAQVNYYTNYIQKHQGWIFCGVFIDEAKTGTKDSRANFNRLIEECRAGNIDLVITKSISRFARNTLTLLERVRELKSLGVDVFFEEQNIHTMSSEGELMLSIYASVAQEESRSVSENQKWRIKKEYEKGNDVSISFLFGYVVKKRKLEIDPETAPIVVEIFERFVAGESLNAIAKSLNERGIKGCMNGTWENADISAIILNEKYMGDAVLQKTFVNNHLEKKRVKNDGQKPKYYVTDNHEPIISRELFYKVQEIYKKRKMHYYKGSGMTKTAFSGLMFCVNCGKIYRRMISNGSVGWICTTYLKDGKSVCSSKKIPESTLEKVTAEVLGLKEFEPEEVTKQIEKISVPAPNHIIYHFKDGRVVEKEWKDKSRRDSWTPEMKEKARQKYLERTGVNK